MKEASKCFSSEGEGCLTQAAFSSPRVGTAPLGQVHHSPQRSQPEARGAKVSPALANASAAVAPFSRTLGKLSQGGHSVVHKTGTGLSRAK